MSTTIVSTTINHGVTLTLGTYASPLTITSTGAINNHGTGHAIFGGTATVVNAGHITATSGTVAYSGVYLSDPGSYLDNSGTITASLYAARLTGGGSVTNSGVMYGGKWGIESRGLISITNTGTVSGGSQGIVLSGGGFINNSKLISGADGIGIGGTVGTVDNSGTIISYGAGVGLGAGGTVSNTGAGLISVTGHYAAVYSGNKYYPDTAQGVVTNAGTITGYVGVSFYATETLSQTLIDSGTIIGSSGTAVAFSSGDDVLQLDPSNSIDIQGTVDGGGGSNTLEFASGASTGTFTNAGAYFVNFNTIKVDTHASWVLAGSNTFGAGVTLTDNGSLIATGTLVNAGFMTGASVAITAAANVQITNQSGGTIAGNDAVLEYTGAATLTNAGVIRGGAAGAAAGIAFESGGAVTNLSGGTISGELGVYVKGAAGAVVNAGHIVGSAGTGIGVLIAAGGTLTNQASATISGAIYAVRFQAGFTNRVVIDPHAVFTGSVEGGNVVGATSISTLELASGASAGTLTGLGTKYTHFVQASIDAGARWTFASANTIAAGYTLTNHGTLTDSGTLVDAGLFINAGSLIADPPITVTGTFINSSIVSAPGTYTAFYVGNGGVLSNTATGIITAGNDAVTAAGTVSISNLGSITGTNGAGIDVNPSSGNLAFVSNAGGGVISGYSNGISAGYLTLTNRGTIEVTGTTATGVSLLAGGNDGLIANYGLLTGTKYAIHAIGDGSLDNSGTIVSTGRYGVRFDGGSPTVTNSGTISGENGLVFLADGTVTNTGTGLITGLNAIGIRGTGSVVNSATISASNGVGVGLGTGGIVSNAAGGVISAVNYDAVFVQSGAGTVVNDGTIIGGTGIAFYGSPTAGTLSETVIDSGTIAGTGGSAIAFGGGSDVLKFAVSTSAAIQGIVDGGNGTNTLEFASAATAGTLTGVGASFAHFTKGTVDTGATWVLAGNVTFDSSVTIATGGNTLLDAGTLVNAGQLAATVGYSALFVAPGGTLSNAATGLISGIRGIAASIGSSINVSNLGTINGSTHEAIRMGAGSVINGATNNTTALITGIYGVYARAATTVTNYGSISGVKLNAGGSVNNAGYIGATGNNGILIRNAAGTIFNTGSVHSGLYAGIAISNTFANSISIGSTGHVSGYDGIEIVGSAAIDNSGSILGSGTGVGAYAIRLTSGTIKNTGTIRGSGALGVTFASNGGTVANYGRISAGLAVSLRGASTLIDAGTLIGSGGTAAAFTGTGLLQFLASNDYVSGRLDGGASASTLQFVSAATTGTLSGSSSFYNFATASIDAGANWVFTGTETIGSGVNLVDAGTLANAGSIALGLTNLSLIAGGYLRNEATGRITAITGHGASTAPAIVGLAGGASTVVNLGLVSDSQFDFGIKMLAGGTVINGSTSDVTAEIYARVPIYIQGGSGAVSNFGTLMSNPVPGGTGGISLNAGGTVVNGAAGSTAALISGAYNGIVVSGSPGTVTNFGTIAATAGKAVLLLDGGTILDAGKIAGGGGTAILFSGTSSGRLILDAGYSVTGSVLGSSSASDALELASGATIGTLSGLGSNFQHFSSYTIDAGARWVFSGTNTIGAGTTLTDSGSLTVAGTLVNAGSLLVDPPITVSGTFINSSIVSAPGATYTAFSLTNGGVLSNTATGIITAGSIAIAAAGTVGISNLGSIIGTAASGIAMASGSVFNGASGSTTALISGGNVGISASGHATIVSYGTIIGADAVVDLATGTVVNAGLISGDATTGDGVLLSAGGMVTNLAGGTITGATGVFDLDVTTVVNAGSIGGLATNGVGVQLHSGGAVTNQSGGTITGGAVAINAVGGASGVVNSGAILGSTVGNGIDLNAGGSIANLAGGTIAANDAIVIYGAATVTNAGGITSSGTGTNGFGVQFHNAGTLTNQSGGTIGGGTGAVKFAAGYTNRLVIDPGAVFVGTVNGGNTIGGTSISTLELASGATAGTLSGLNTKYLGFAQVTVDATANWVLYGSNSVAAGQTLNIAGGLTASGTLINHGVVDGISDLTLSGASFTNAAGGYVNVAGIYGVSAAGTSSVANFGTISASSGYAIYLRGTGNVSNASGGLINAPTGVRLNGTNATLANLGTINAYQAGPHSYAAVLRNGGVVLNGATNDTTATISGYTGIYVIGGSGQIVNDGSIIGFGATADGVMMFSGGTVINGGTGVTHALISGGNDGVIIEGAGSVANWGTIAGTAGYGVLITGTGTLDNYGVISGGQQAGVQFGDTANVVNQGAITGYTDGIYAANGGTIVNSGTIRATGSSGYGIFLSGSGTIIDAGTISGSYAIRFHYTSALLILESGYALQGSVVGKGGGSENVIELLGSSGTPLTVNYDNLTLTNFNTIAFAPGNSDYATLRLGNNVTLPHTIAGFAGTHDTVDLAGLAYVTGSSHSYFNSASDKLTITNGTSSVTLQLGGGTYTGMHWAVRNDGTGGTDVTPQLGQTNFNIPDETTLNSVFALIGVGGTYAATNTDFTLTVTNNFTLTSAVSSLTLASGDTLRFIGGGHTIDGGSAAHNFLNVAAPVTIANLALVNAQATIVAGETWKLTGSDTFGAGTTLTNSGTLIDSGTLTDAGTIVNGVTLGGATAVLSVGSTGAIINGGTASAAVVGYAGGLVSNYGTIRDSAGSAIRITGAAGSVINLGAIDGTAAAGISLGAGGSVNNGGMVTGTSGVLITGGIGTVNAAGTVVGTSGAAISLAAGGYVIGAGTVIGGSGVVITGGAGTVSNGGSIIGTSSAGVSLGAGGSVSNAIDITGTSGVAITGGYGVISNGGGIYGTSGAGITLAAGGSISSAGTVTGASGIVITGGAGNVSNGGTIIGTAGAGVSFGAGGYVSNGFLISGTTGVTIAGSAGTVRNGGTISGSVGVAFSGTFNDTLIDGGTIIGTGGTAVSFAGGSDLLKLQVGVGAFIQGTVNGGGGSNTLEFASSATVGTLTGAGAYFVNFATGTVDAGANWVLAGSNSFASTVTLTDAGTLTNVGTASNLGQIAGGAGDAAITIAAGSLGNGGTIAGGNGGVGTAGGVGAGGIGGTGAAGAVLTGGSLNNSGTIAGGFGGAGGYGQSNGGAAGAGGVGLSVVSASLTSVGTITGGTGGFGGASGTVGTGGIGGAGGVGLRIQASTLTNDGSITGGLGGDGGSAGSGNDGVGGDGGAGGAGVYLVSGAFTNNGTITGGHGGFYGYGNRSGSYVINGSGGNGVSVAGGNLTNNGLITGGAYTVGLEGGATAGFGVAFHGSGTLIDTGTIIGAATAVAFGGTTDLLQFQSGNAFIGGVVNGGTGSSTLEFASGASTGTLTGGAADFVNFATASVDAGASWVLAGTNTLGASVSLVDAGTLTNTGTLVVDPPVTVTGTFINSSIVSAPGTYTAIAIANGGVVSNTTSGVISSGGEAITAAGTVSITNLGTISGSITGGIALAAGSVINGATASTTALISGGTAGIEALGAATVTNFGTIIGYYPGLGSAGPGTGVALLAGGSVDNAGRISANLEGILINNATGTVTDSGTIFGGTAAVLLLQAGNVSISAGGRLYGRSGVSVLAGTIINGGQITGGSGGYGVWLQNGGSLGNTGGITDTAANAVWVFGGTATISNYGTITGGASYDGIKLGGGGTVIDGGTISGGTAVYFGGTGSNLLILTHGYALHGHMTGAAAASNTLELLGTSAAASVSANYSSLGLTNFSTVAFAAGNSNYATLTITNTAAVPHTITSFTGSHDTIDLTTLAYVSGSSSTYFNTATDRLTITAGTNAVALTLGSGSYSNVHWKVTNDGGTGTDVMVQATGIEFNIPDETTLNSVFGLIGVGGTYSATNTNFLLNITSDFTLTSAVSSLTLGSGDALSFIGAGHTIDGGSAAHNFLNVIAPVTINNLAIVNAQATIVAGESWTFTGTDTIGTGTTLTNSGSLHDSGTLTIAGTVVGSIYGYSGVAPLTVTAAGYATNGGTNAAIYFNSGTVVNFGTIAASGNSASNDGVRIRGAGSVDNHGTITGHYGVLSYGYLTVSNSGTIGTSGSRDGVFLRGGGSVNNTGVILGSVGVNGPALSLATTINNAGTIRGQNGIDFAATDTAASTVIDSGTIIGLSGPAVQFGAGTNAMVFVPGNAFVQDGVVGGATAVSNTLEFASAAATGTLTGAGAYFINFGNGTVDSGARWVLAGSNTFGATTTLTNSGTLTDTGTLTNAGTLLGALTVGSGAILTNASGGRITSSNSAVVGNGGLATVVNAGSIVGNPTAASGFGILLNAGGLISNQSGGVITAQYAITDVNAAVTIDNVGTILSNTTASGRGVNLGAGGIVSNQSGGLISAEYGVFAQLQPVTVVNAGRITDGNTNAGGGVELLAGGLVSNQSGGTVTGSFGVLASANPSTVVNAGRIVGYFAGVSGVGVYVSGGGAVSNQSGGTILGFLGISGQATALTVTNAGSVGGNATSGAGVSLTAGGQVTNQSGGVITGKYGVRASGHSASLVNAGSIGGNLTTGQGVALTAGGTVTNLSGGTITGLQGVRGTSSSAVVVNAGDIAGNASTASGNGVALYKGGTITNLAGGSISGFTGIFGGTIAVTVIDSGTIIGNGGTAIGLGTANDVLQFVAGNAFIQGTVNGGGGTNTLQFASGGSTGTLTGSNAYFVNFQTASVDAGANWVFAGSNTLGASTTLLDAGTLTNTGSLVVDPPITVTGTLINSNLVTASGGAAAQLAPGAYLLNTGSGTIVGDGTNPVVTSEAGAASSVVNLGTITNSGSAAGLRFLGNAVVINGTSGTSSALIAGGTLDRSGDYGISLQGVSNTITNFGTIRGYRAAIYSDTNGETDQIINGATNVTTALMYGHYNAFYASVGSTGTILNFGTIAAHGDAGVVVDGMVINGASNDTAALITAHLVGVAMAGSGTDTVVNFGTIEAGTYLSAIDISPSATDWFANYGHIIGYVTLRVGTAHNSGTIIGGGLYQGGGTLTNLGTIIALGAGGPGVIVHGGDLTNGSLGSSAALISGNTAVRLYSYSGETVTNLATIAGGVGISVFASGTIGQNVIDSGSIIGTSGTAIAFGAGNDMLQFQPGTAFIQGTVDGGGGANTLQFTSSGSAGTLTGSNADFINFQTASVDAGASWVFSGTNTLGSSTTLVDAGTLTNTGTLVVDPPVTVSGTFVNTDLVTVTGTYTAISVISSGVLTNTGTGAIIGGTGTTGPGGGHGGTGADGVDVASGGVFNQATITGGTGGYASGGYGGAGGVGVNVASGSVTNQATITGGAGGSHTVGVGGVGGGGVVVLAGSLTNTSSGIITGGDGSYGTGFGGGGGFGVDVGAASLTNQGTIRGGAGAYSANFSGSGGAGVDLTSGSLSNQGTIVGGAGADGGSTFAGYAGAGGAGVALTGGSLSNQGMIVGGAGAIGGDGQVGAAGGAGVAVAVGGLIVTNLSTIIGGSVAASSYGAAGGAGVSFQAGGTLIDAGFISGGTGTSGTAAAVYFAGTASNLLILEQGYTLQGAVVGSASASLNTIELLGTSSGSAVTANYNSLSLTHIGTIAFAPGAGNYATWRLSNNAALPGVVTNFVGPHDTIDLTALNDAGNNAFTTFDTIHNKLTVTAGTASVTLQLGAASYSGVHFGVTNDGSNGTDITIASSIQTGFLIHNETELNAAFAAIGAGGVDSTINTNFTLTLANGFSLTSAVSALTLASGDALILNGAGYTLNGGGTAFGFLTDPGAVTIDNLGFINGVATAVSGASWTFAGSNTIGAAGTLNSTAALTNSGTLSVGGMVADAGALTNNGVVLVAGGALTAGGLSGSGSVTLGANGTLGLTGAVSTTETIAFNGTGALLSLGSGGLITSASTGLTVATGGDTVINAGSIGGGGTTNGVGIQLLAGGSVTNQSGGTIGGYIDAVRFAAGFDNLLAIDPGAAFSGTVDGGNAIGGGSASMLELASGASAGTLAGLGSQYIDFAQTTIDTGARWTIGGVNTLIAGATLTNSGSLTNSGTIFDSGSISNVGSLINNGRVVLETGTLAPGSLSGSGTIAFGSGTGDVLSFTSAAASANVVSGFIVGQTIELAGQTITDTSLLNSNTLLVDLAAGGPLDITLDPNQAYAGDLFDFANSGGNGFVTVQLRTANLGSFNAYQGTPDQTPIVPFGTATITDPTSNPSDTLTVTLSSLTTGTLSNFSGGSYNAATGEYSITGTPTVVTAALNALTFTPIAQSNSPILTTTTLAVSVSNVGGTATPVITPSVTSVRQVLFLGALPASQIAISVTPDGSGVAAPQNGKTNEAVILTPAANGSYVVPEGYQAAFLGGTVNAELTDTATGNALLVGNPGNDTLSATAANDTILGGAGSNLMFGGNGALLLSNGASDTIGALSGGASVQASGNAPLIFGDFTASAGSLSVSVGGAAATVSAGNSAAAITTGGSGALVYGGFGAQAGALSLVDTGRGDTVSAGDSSASLTLSGTNALVFGGFGAGAGSLNVTDGGSGDTISAGNSAATITGGAGPLLVFGGAGTLNVVGGSGGATVVAGTGATSVAGGAGGSTLYGSAGSAFTFTGGNAALYVAANGNESLNASGSSGGNELVAGADSTAGNLIVGGSGNDTLYAGAGADTLAGGSGNNLFAFFSSLTRGNADVVSDFNANDTMYLSGYGANDAATALAGATSSGGNTTITLSDNTRITFLGVGAAGALQGHVLSF